LKNKLYVTIFLIDDIASSGHKTLIAKL